MSMYVDTTVFIYIYIYTYINDTYINVHDYICISIPSGDYQP